MTRRMLPQFIDPRATMDDFLGPTKPKRKKFAGSARKGHIEEMRERVRLKDYKGVTPGRLVAMYWVAHETVYGVTARELDNARTWEIAMRCAGKMVKVEFDGDVGRAVDFMVWTWADEQRVEKWRIANEKNGRRITWQNQFIHNHLVTNWLRAVASRK